MLSAAHLLQTLAPWIELNGDNHRASSWEEDPKSLDSQRMEGGHVAFSSEVYGKRYKECRLNPWCGVSAWKVPYLSGDDQSDSLPFSAVFLFMLLATASLASLSPLFLALPRVSGPPRRSSARSLAPELKSLLVGFASGTLWLMLLMLVLAFFSASLS